MTRRCILQFLAFFVGGVLCAAPLFAAKALSSGTLWLDLHITSDAVTLNRATVRPLSFFPPRGETSARQGTFRFEVRDSKGELRYEGAFLDPRILHHDEPRGEGTSELTGGTIHLPETDFLLKIPAIPGRLRIEFFLVGQDGKVRSISHFTIDVAA
ncbi:MAG: hypothetical protein D6795_08710 [Deltaproteobacteria bacterium]|nr:MAG: hypothetical protein D6795_08710 [Deltaproteobacteria bacterium]